MIQFLDYFFTFAHLFIIALNSLGWIFKKTRRINLICLGLTFLCWFGLGAFYGWGYCALTDWHYKIKIQLGESSLPHSYIKYLLDNYLGLEFSPYTVDMLTFGVFFSSLTLSIFLNLKDYKKTIN